MTRTTGTRPTAAAQAAGALRNSFRERVITPPVADDDKGRALWNGAIDKRPALIARCADATGVAAALRAALDTGLPIAVRGDGHGVACTAPADDGLVIDLSPMRRRAWGWLDRIKGPARPGQRFRLNQNIEPAPADGRTHGGRR